MPSSDSARATTRPSWIPISRTPFTPWDGSSTRPRTTRSNSGFSTADALLTPLYGIGGALPFVLLVSDRSPFWIRPPIPLTAAQTGQRGRAVPGGETGPRSKKAEAVPDLLITEEVRDTSLDALAAEFSVEYAPELWRTREAVLERVREARALMVRNMTIVDRELIAAAGRLEVVGRIGVGLDNLDLPALSERGVVVCYPPEENAVSVAEHVFALLLGFARRLPAADRSLRAGEWDRGRFIGFELAGKQLAILGLGRIGFRVAVRARAFGMHVRAYDPFLTAQHPYVTESSATLVSLETALREADVVTCHLPLTAETRGLLNAARLGWMQPHALLINTSRGPVVEEAALCAALTAGRLGGAALDVFEREPPGQNPLFQLPNVVLTPHIASWTHESLRRVISTVTADVRRILSGHPAENFANFPAPRRA
ncbi:MAG: hydroxyacid dehydrogenase [Armatimonadetes bacterium]|nr:hydroxyacid dehydrogenase [Armatimonadota bacterium]